MLSILKNENKPLWALNRTQKEDCKKYMLGKLLFYAAFFSFALKYTLDYSGLIPVRPEMLNSMLVAASISCSMAKILIQRYTLPRLFFTMAICVVIGYSSLVSTNNNFLMGFLLIVGMQDIKLESVIKAALFVKVLSMFVHVVSYIFVFFTNPEAIVFVFRAGVGIPRHFFFMGHANTFMAFLFWSCLDYIYLRYKKINVLDMAAIWIIILLFYTFTLSNTSIITLTIITVLIFLDKAGKVLFDKLLTVLAKYSYLLFSILFTILVVIFIYLDGPLLDFWHTLNTALTGRLWLGAHAYHTLGPTILGRPDIAPTLVFWHGRWFNTMTVFDNHYIGNLVSYGIINLVLTSVVFIVFCSKLENREKLIIIAFSFFAIMQNDVTNLIVCSGLFIVGKYLYRR